MVINPRGLYSENQGIFNSTPFTQFAIQQEAKRQAKDEALDTYYQNLPKSINSAGLRNQDTAGFIDKINGIRDFYAKNREAIKNPRLDRGKAQAEYQARNTDASMYVNQSKAEELKKAPFVKILANPDMRERVMDSDLQRLHEHDLPLNDPNRKSFDFSTIDFNPKELSPQELAAYQSKLTQGFTPDEKVVGEIPNAKDLTITRTFQKQWSPEQLKATADKDLANVNSDRRLEYNAQQTWKRVSQSPEQFGQYNDIFKKLYGKDIQTPAELHAAMQVGGIMGSSKRDVVVPDENARDLRNFNQQKQLQAQGFANQKKLEGIKQANREAIKRFSGGVDAKNDENVLNTFIKHQYDAGSDKFLSVSIDGQKYKGRVIDVPKSIKDSYAIKSKDTNVENQPPDDFYLTEDKTKLIPLFYEKDDKGEIKKTPTGNNILKANSNSKPINIQNYKVDLGKLLLTQKARGGEVIDEYEDDNSPTQSGGVELKVKTTTKSGLPVFHK